MATTVLKAPVKESYQLYIGGKWTASSSGRTFPVLSPVTGEALSFVADAERADVRAAIAEADRARRDWDRRTGGERAAILRRAAELLRERQEAIAQILTAEQGKPLTEARTEVDQSVIYLEWFAEEAKRVYGEILPRLNAGKRQLVIRQPVGVVGAITPWNFPSLMIIRKVGAALAAGCTVVLKPAELTPLTALELTQVFHEAGLPAGVLNVVTAQNPAPVGEEFVSNPAVRMIAFTGSTEVGQLLMRGAAEHIKKIALELGGHAPVLVFDDANLDKAVQGSIISKFRNAGQTCICANRLYVQEGVFEAFSQRFAEAVSRLKVGPGWVDGVQVGPLVEKAALEKVQAHVDDAVRRGARVLTGGKPLQLPEYPHACFFEPTVLAGVQPGSRILEEETFGPVIPLIPFREEREGIELANSTRYGLAAYVFTENISRGIRVSEQLEFGIVGLNDVLPATAHVPFGGIKMSGIGKEGGRQGVQEFQEEKLVVIGVEE